VISQYSFDAFLLNPAAAGSEGYTTINFSARRQGFGIPGSPETISLSFQARLYKRVFLPSSASVRRKHNRPKRSGKVGLGAHVIKDKFGIFDHTGMRFSYAYHITGQGYQLSMGLGLSILQHRIDSDAIITEFSEDRLLNNIDRSFLSPDFNAGVYYTNRKIFLGFSVENATEIVKNLHFYFPESFSQRQFNLVLGYKLKLNEHIDLEPSMYIKSASFLSQQIDVNLRLLIYNSVWVGITYRSEYTTSLHAGFRINRVYVGYAFDYNFLISNKVCFTGHEIMFAVKIGDNVRRYKWLERY
jgi:type IX secretion system PorP/SprF family membrane protein